MGALATTSFTGDWALDGLSGAAYRFTQTAGSISLERSNSLLAPSWSPVFSLPGVETRTALCTDRVDARGLMVVVVSHHRLFVSTDTAVSWFAVGGTANLGVPAAVPVVSEPTSADSSDGITVGLMTASGAAYLSESGGLEFVAAQQFASPLSRPRTDGGQLTPMTVAASRASARTFVAYSRVGDGQGYVTTNGFTAIQPLSPSLPTNEWAWLSFDPGADTYNLVGVQSARASSAPGVPSSQAFTPPLPAGFAGSVTSLGVGGDFHPRAVVMDCVSSQGVWLVDTAAETSTRIDGRVLPWLKGQLPCAGETFAWDGGVRARFVSGSGWLATSDDLGATFQFAGGLDAGLCSGQRNLTSMAVDRSILVTWCGDDAWFSRNSGLLWHSLTASTNWRAYGCGEITSVTVTTTGFISPLVLSTCRDRPPLMMWVL